jgi:hypothetical protein
VPCLVNQNICLKQHKGLTMNQLSTTPSPSTQPLQALRERIECGAPGLRIIRCIEQPYPFIEVKDTSNLDIHVTFSSEVEFTLYIQVVGKGTHA